MIAKGVHIDSSKPLKKLEQIYQTPQLAVLIQPYSSGREPHDEITLGSAI